MLVRQQLMTPAASCKFIEVNTSGVSLLGRDGPQPARCSETFHQPHVAAAKEQASIARDVTALLCMCVFLSVCTVSSKRELQRYSYF